MSTGADAVENPVAESVSKLIRGSQMIKGTGLVRVSMTATLAHLRRILVKILPNRQVGLLTPCVGSVPIL